VWCHTIDVKLMADDVARAYRRAGFKVHTSPFCYSFPMADNAGQNVDVPVVTETDRDSIFVWLSTSVFMFDQSIPSHRWFAGQSLQITHLDTGYKVVGPDRVLPHQLLTGVDGADRILGFPYVFPPGSRILATFRDAGDESEIFLSLNGVKLFTTPYTRTALLPDVPGVEAL
jgi:hypothetical protein